MNAQARILLIEDDDAMRRMLSITLRQLGFTVVEAGDGQRGMVMQRDDPADLVLTDIIMPERDGIEALLDMRRRAPQVPVIAMSGGGRISAADHLLIAARLGAAATLQKPFTTEQLKDAIDKALADPRTPHGGASAS
jgi:two-component system, chemotaxis family, chemotaxis protein CheY